MRNDILTTSILFSVNCERSSQFSIKHDLCLLKTLVRTVTPCQQFEKMELELGKTIESSCLWELQSAPNPWRRFLMTSSQEPNTMAPHSALCICSRKWKTKLIVSMYFGNKTSKFCFRIISLKFLHCSQSWVSIQKTPKYLDRTRSTIVNSPLRALRAIYNISSDEGEEFFADELHVY